MPYDLSEAKILERAWMRGDTKCKIKDYLFDLKLMIQF